MRALLSVYDKTGIVELARELRGLGWDLISSGGTAKALREADLAVTDVADLTGSPAILGHRVVTLHPKVHGGILADRRNPDHQKDMAEHGIEPIDLVVSNLYPFGASLESFEHGASRAEELIDIGGPGHDPGGGQELPRRRHPHPPVAVPAGGRRAEGRRRAVRRHQAPARPHGLRPHRGLRRRHRRLVRRGGRRPAAAHASTSPSSGCRTSATARTRTRPAPATARSGTTSWWDGVEQHGGHGAQLPQPLRRRRGVGSGQRPRRDRSASRRSPSSSTPTRAARRSPTRWPRRTSGPSSATSGRRSAASSPCPHPVDDATVERMVAGRPGRRRHRARLRRRRDRGAGQEAEEHAAAHRRAAGARRAPDPPAHRLVAGAGRPPLRVAAGRLAGRHQARAHRRRSGPTPSWRGASSAG